MQIRCHNCHKPFALNKEVVQVALDEVFSQNLHHYNAYCPHCRRANRVSRQELQRAAPGYQPQTSQEPADE